jgi:hypothetical protein
MKSLKDSLSKVAALTVKISVFAYIKIVSLPLTITLFNLFFSCLWRCNSQQEGDAVKDGINYIYI